nr:hypothetical protein GCM10025699_19230 [Microbacterium flavescens]
MPQIAKVLVANRGEIAVRVIRAARDAGKASVAVYAEQDRDALHARLADEAYALDGTTGAETYLSIEKILSVARRSGADAVHPGYGFLAENAEFARAVIGAGLIWIGPSPEAIESLGDKVTARAVAEKVGAPLAPGTPGPVAGADEVVAFAEQVGLPIAIKAAYGGGGRGLKVARTMDEVPELFESATREAITAFGRGECFVEKYLDKPRHVETQCLADAAGNVVVISTRDCSLQRRHQKLVEEAPAPFLTDEQNTTLYASSKAILKEVGYVGAGTCEFLIGADGTISFLEVNTRLQVEHPVSEEVTGIDLVREQFRLAEGEELGYDDPTPEGHSIEFRINGEDPGRGFLPQPGPIHVFKTFGVRASASTPASPPATPSRARSTRSSRRSSSPDATALRRSSAHAARSTSSRWRACRPCCLSIARSCATPPSRPRTAASASSRAGSRPSSSTTSPRGTVSSRRPSPASTATPSSSRSPGSDSK